ncbi:MAG: 23S rRNA (adenine(2503)-C(2))-methyltransferase RlmN [Clostridiales bacterium]|nr:23S rRNA (adenine(2503)-C(2))-methyltransferase RlmN [Clostridiales bacterium]
MNSWLELSFDEAAERLKAAGYPSYRTAQLYPWIVRGATWDEMTNLPRDMREQLKQTSVVNPVGIRSTHRSRLDDTEKFLFELADGNLIEGVLMRYHHGNSLCVSTQVGCRMGCAFCASTLEGCVRDLTAGEMLGQVVAANRHLGDAKVRNVVLMGSGEPLDNYDNTVRFLRLAIDARGLNLSIRGISLSTCGLVPGIRQLAGEGLPVTLCISLHAPNDAIRGQLLPVARAYPIDQLIAACRDYVGATGRRVIFEYALIDGVNCLPEHADELAGLLRGLQCHVNLIPLNPIAERGLRPPSGATIDRFIDRLARRRISVTKRRSLGEDIQGACGQLRRGALSEREETGESPG